MRILRVHGTTPGWGGAEDYITNISRMLEAQGHPQRILVLREGEPDRTFPEEKTLRLPPMGPARLVEEMGPTDAVLDFLDEQVEDFAPDILHLHNILNQELASIARFVADSDLPVVMTGHDATLVCPIATLLRPGNVICEGGILPRCLFTGCEVGYGGPLMIWRRRMFDRWILPKINAFFCPSKSLAGYFYRNGYRPAVHLPSFASIPEGVRAAPPTRNPGATPRIGFLGRVESYKGLDDLVRAVARLRKAGRPAIVEVAGEGPDRPRVESLARDLGMTDAVHWAGRVAGAAKEEWLASLHALVVPSRTFENFPLVALEALVREIPVIGTRIGGIPETVRDGITGRIVPLSDAPALARAIEEVLDHPDRATEWARRGRRMVLTEYTPEIHRDRLLAAYGKVLGPGAIADPGDGPTPASPTPEDTR